MTTPQLDLSKNPPSPKMIAVTTVMLVLPIVTAAGLYLQTDQGVSLYAALPVYVLVPVKSALAGLTAWLVGLRTIDPQRVLDLATSPKVVYGVLGGVVVQAVLDLVIFLMGDGQGLYSSLHPVLVVAISAGLPAVAAGLASYLVKDPARVTPTNPVPKPIEPVEITTAGGQAHAIPPQDGDPTALTA